MTTIVGAQSRGVFEPAENGGIALGLIADHYFGTWGAVILAVTVTFACLKTAVGLVTSCSEAFVNMFPKGPGYKAWAIIISVFSFAISNVGLTAIIDYSIPVLMFLYPLSITLILVSLFGGRFKKDSAVLKSITAFTFIAALADFFGALPKDVISALHIGGIFEKVNSVLPFSDLGLGYLLVFPFTFRFLMEYDLSPSIENQINLSSYIGNFTMLILVMGLVFEMPLLAWLLSQFGILHKSFLREYRRHAVVGLMVLAAVITPSGDPFTLMLVFIPLYFLYELSIMVIKE